MPGRSIDDVRELFRDELGRHLACLTGWGFGAPTFRHDDDTLLPVLVARYVSERRRLDLALVVDHFRC